MINVYLRMCLGLLFWIFDWSIIYYLCLFENESAVHRKKWDKYIWSETLSSIILLTSNLSKTCILFSWINENEQDSLKNPVHSDSEIQVTECEKLWLYPN